jgi:hypothetical protein
MFRVSCFFQLLLLFFFGKKTPPDWTRISIEPKMLDPDPESMNPDPKHCPKEKTW